MKYLTGIVVVLALVVLGGTYNFRGVDKAVGSVQIGHEYQGTTTYTGFTNYSVLDSGPGALGSVVITGAGSGTFTIYDATSTVTNTAWPTTTLASFPTNAATGTYTFDRIFQKGLLVDFKGTMGTTTITWH